MPSTASVRHGRTLIDRKRCGCCGHILPVSEFHRRDAVYLASYCKPCGAASTRRYRSRSAEKRLYLSCKARAKRLGLPFEITREDIIIPPRCPALGIPLIETTGARTAHTPSVDRLTPGLGYVPGNVRVVSWRANRLKSDASPEELSRLAVYATQPK